MSTDKSPDTMGVVPTLEEPLTSTSVGGRKSINVEAEEAPSVVSSDDESSYLSEEDEDSLVDLSDYEEEEDEEEDEAWLERLRILGDARQLKKVAEFFLHPEKPVETESSTSARCFFERASAPECTSAEEEAEYIQVMAETTSLKKSATYFAHPEHSVEVEDPTVFARCYFARVSTVDQASQEEADESARILEDAKILKEAAYQYLHPEEPVKCTDATVFGRNYFTRASELEQESMEEAEERVRILAEVQSLRKHVEDYLHPEILVRTTDPAACGRNYFNRPSAPDAEDAEDAEERVRILKEASLLKKSAKDYLHPETRILSTDGTASGRNYFDRPSAPETEDIEDMEERVRILEEAALLKKSAVDYLHPEAPVLSTDGTAFGRNYFDRPSAPETEDIKDAEERARILEEVALLKKIAVDYLHPEAPVLSTDGTAFGSNYFNRPSASKTEEIEDAEERACILEEATLLKKSAVDYLHPEAPVLSSDGTSFGRNYFDRPSALERENIEDAEERVRILAETKLLKKSAVDYLHSEAPVLSTDGTAFGRNYFDRPSAPETEDIEDMEEKVRILGEAALLKKSAVGYLHPEAPVLPTDGTAFGRNYFDRPSAPETEDVKDAEERARILAETKLLKKIAVDYLHPDITVCTADAAACGRNYFSRASAPKREDVEAAEERARILEEVALLKKSAVDYLHPEAPVLSTDGTAFGRNYFNRPSAPGTDDVEAADYVVVDKQQVLKSMGKTLVLPNSKQTAKKISSGERGTQEEGNLSRSPSSVMLFNSGMAEEAF